MMLLVALAFLYAAEPQLAGHPCSYYEEGTDAWIECTTGEEIDLSPQDEADTTMSHARN